jgi:hypothetical protein
LCFKNCFDGKLNLLEVLLLLDPDSGQTVKPTGIKWKIATGKILTKKIAT